MIKEEPKNSFILTFKSNEPNVIQVFNGKTEVVGHLRELTKSKAEYFGKDDKNRIEISIGMGTFLEIKDNPLFHLVANNLVRLRTTKQNVLGYLAFPVNSIDNELTINK